ncbi:hypothetical protein ACFL9T_05080 [Thermodesulfobacteriota bacterium]
MRILELFLFLPIAGLAYFYLKIKSALRMKNFNVDKPLSLVSDYYKFKNLIESDISKEERKRYKAILLGLHISFTLLALVIFIGMILLRMNIP